MKITLYVLTLLAILFTPLASHAQGQNNQWFFGRSYGLNFNTTPPSFFQTNMNVIEGSAAVCDAAGNLMFYSSGGYVWDRNGNYMPNGQGLSGNGPSNGTFWPENAGSSASGVVIVPAATNPNQYYLVTTDAVEDQIYNAYYSLIDMSLNGGLGDVVLTQKNILLSTDISEGVIATTAAGCSGYWVLLHSRYGDEYRAFRIDNNGMSTTPVLSTGITGGPTMLGFGYSRFNNAGTKIARSSGEIEVGDFNKATGVISGFFTLQPTGSSAGQMAFSPDDTKLYLANYSGLRQFNFSLLPNVAAVQSSQLLIDTAHLTAIRLGPDHKIYLTSLFTDYIHVINSPNTLGTGCQFMYHVMTLPSYASVGFLYALELGNETPVNLPADTTLHAARDTLVCFEPSITLRAPGNYPFYLWSNNATTLLITVHQDGVYWVQGFNSCSLTVDTFKVHFVYFDFNLGGDTSICDGAQIVLDATTPGAFYKWQDNSILPTYTVSNSGLYKVRVAADGCIRYDSVLVDIMKPFVNIVEDDTTICKDEPFALHGTAFPQSNYSWNTGASSLTIPVNEAGHYILTASNVCGDFADSVNIEMMDCFCDAFMPNAFSPNNDGHNDIFKTELNCPGMTGFRLKIFNRFGQCVFEGNEPGQGWDGYQNNSRADMGTYFYYLQYKDANGTLIKKKGDIVLIR